MSPAADPTFPIENILQPGMAAVYQSLPGDNNVIIQIDRGTGTLPDMAGIVLYGLSIEANLAASLIVQSSANIAFSSLGIDMTVIAVDLSASGSQPFRPPWGDTAPVVFPSTTVHRYLRIILETTAGGFLRLAGVTGSGYWQSSANHEIDLGFMLDGAVRNQIAARDPHYVFFAMSIAKGADLQNIARNLGTFGRFGWVPSPADRTTYAQTAGYGTFKEAPREVGASGSGGQLRVTSLALLEATR